MLIKASQYFEKTSFSINFTSVFINTCDDSQMNPHKDNFLMSFHKHLILLYNTSIMPAFTEEEKRILLQTPIELILSHFGKATEHRRGNMFYSPFRDECTPSFHVNPNNNTWYDFGAGEGGGIIDIVTRLAGCSRSQAYDFLASVRKDFVALSQYSYPKEKGKANRIGIASSMNIFRNRSLISYAEERGISLETLESFCTEVIYSIDGIRGRQFYAIGFRNDSGGYVLRSRFSKKCTSSDLSTLKCIPENDRSSVAVFEGFFDFLSWYEDNGYCTLPCDVCILNSVVNTERSLDFLKGHDNIFIYFDNDNAGKKATQSITENVTAEGIMVQDMSDTYSGYNDYNEMLKDRISKQQSN